MSKWICGILLMLVALSSCGADTNDVEEDEVRIERLEYDDSRSVTCVVFEDNYRGGVSCDWSEKEE